MQEKWFSLDVKLGPLPFGPNGGKSFYRITSADVPEDAVELSFYAWIETGRIKDDFSGNRGHFKFLTEQELGRGGLSAYLRFFAYAQSAWNCNSSNFILPMPIDRQILIERNDQRGKGLEGNISSGLWLTGYKILVQQEP